MSYVSQPSLGGGGDSGLGTLITSVTVSDAATLDLENVFDDTYDIYKVICVQMVGATDNTSLELRIGTGATPTWQTGTSYRYVGGTRSSMQISSLHGNAANEFVSGEVIIYDPSNASTYANIAADTLYTTDTGNIILSSYGTVWANTTPVTSLRFYQSSGNVSGTVYIYGLNKS